MSQELAELVHLCSKPTPDFGRAQLYAVHMRDEHEIVRLGLLRSETDDPTNVGRGSCRSFVPIEIPRFFCATSGM